MSKEYYFNVYMNDDYRLSVIPFKQFIDKGYLTIDTDNICDRLDIYLDDNITVEQAEVVTYIMGDGDWLLQNGIDDYVGDVDDWRSYSELLRGDGPVPALLQDFLDRLPEYELEVA